MLKNLKLEKPAIAEIGEEIGLELGNELIYQYQSKNPNDVLGYQIGRNILDQILAQPGCLGIKLYNAYNESGEKTLVYVGMDANGKAITSITSVNCNGILSDNKGIVADRSIVIIKKPGAASDADDWGWSID